MRRVKVLIELIILAVTAGMIVATPGGASPTAHKTTCCRMTTADFKAWVEDPDHNIGPSHYTGGGVMQITGFAAGQYHSACDCTGHWPKENVYNGWATTPSKTAVRWGGSAGGKRDCWFVFCNPFDWDWEDMFTVAHNWDNVWDFMNKCANGQHDSSIDAVSANTALYMLGNGRAFAVFTPEGLVAIVVGGCVIGVIH